MNRSGSQSSTEHKIISSVKKQRNDSFSSKKISFLQYQTISEASRRLIFLSSLQLNQIEDRICNKYNDFQRIENQIKFRENSLVFVWLGDESIWFRSKKEKFPTCCVLFWFRSELSWQYSIHNQIHNKAAEDGGVRLNLKWSNEHVMNQKEYLTGK